MKVFFNDIVIGVFVISTA